MQFQIYVRGNSSGPTLNPPTRMRENRFQYAYNQRILASLFVSSKFYYRNDWFLNYTFTDPAIYPHFDLYPAVAVPVKTAGQPSCRRDLHAHTGVTVNRTATPLNRVWPYQKVEDVTSPIEVRLPSVYPSFDLCEFHQATRIFPC